MSDRIQSITWLLDKLNDSDVEMRHEYMSHYSKSILELLEGYRDILSAIKVPCDAFNTFALIGKQNNVNSEFTKPTPIELLVAQYEENSDDSDFSNIKETATTALEYVNGMPDSFARCLLYVLSSHIIKTDIN